MSASRLGREIAEIAARPPPALSGGYQRHQLVRALFVPEARAEVEGDVLVVTLADLMGRK